jgi:hypothetical protein
MSATETSTSSASLQNDETEEIPSQQEEQIGALFCDILLLHQEDAQTPEMKENRARELSKEGKFSDAADLFSEALSLK